MGYGTNGTQQVGAAGLSGGIHAILWNGSATDYIDLNPSGFGWSSAQAINGSYQVGCASTGNQPSSTHAILWNGTPQSAIDLNPAGYTNSTAYDLVSGQQVGWAVKTTYSQYHAMLWRSSASAYVDLNPTGFTASYAYGTNGPQQVGNGTPNTGFLPHATVWSGSPGSYVDLQQFLPSGFNESVAYDIDESGNIVGTAWNWPSNTTYAFLWVPVPEPATMSLLCLGGLALLRRPK